MRLQTRPPLVTYLLFDASRILLRPRQFRPISQNENSSQWVGDMMLQSGLTNQFCFDYISRKNEGDNKRRLIRDRGKM